MHTVDEELGTIDNLSRNQLETESESTILREPDKRERNGEYEQPAVASEYTSEDTMASADADVTSSAASLVVTWPAGSSHKSKVRLHLTTTDLLHVTTYNFFPGMTLLHELGKRPSGDWNGASQANR